MIRVNLPPKISIQMMYRSVGIQIVSDPRSKCIVYCVLLTLTILCDLGVLI